MYKFLALMGVLITSILSVNVSAELVESIVDRQTIDCSKQRYMWAPSVYAYKYNCSNAQSQINNFNNNNNPEKRMEIYEKVKTTDSTSNRTMTSAFKVNIIEVVDTGAGESYDTNFETKQCDLNILDKNTDDRRAYYDCTSVTSYIDSFNAANENATPRREKIIEHKQTVGEECPQPRVSFPAPVGGGTAYINVPLTNNNPYYNVCAIEIKERVYSADDDGRGGMDDIPPYELMYPDSDYGDFDYESYTYDIDKEEYSVEKQDIDIDKFQREREACNEGSSRKDIQGCFKIYDEQSDKKSFP